MVPVSAAAVAPGPVETADRAVAVFDIDGVLADVTHRLHHIERRPKDWPAFFAAAHRDPPLPAGVGLAREVSGERPLLYLTGRPESLRSVTQRWLDDHGLPPGPLLMRRSRDFRPARLAKLERLREVSAQTPVHVVVDDDVAVVETLRASGFAVLHATWAPVPRGPRQDTLWAAQEEDGRT